MARQPTAALDSDSLDWLRSLDSAGTERAEAVERLREVLLRAARFELDRRHRGARDDLDDLAAEAADDALVAVMNALHNYRGSSRFLSWACKYSLRGAAVKSRAREWHGRRIPAESETWSRWLAANGPPQTPLVDALRQSLIPAERALLVAVALEGVPLDVLAERRASSRATLYAELQASRSKLRARLASDAQLVDSAPELRS